MKEEWALENDLLKGTVSSPEHQILSTRSVLGSVGSCCSAASAAAWVGDGASGVEVFLLSCVSPLGAELEESNKNTKKLDAMTLIKEGGS